MQDPTFEDLRERVELAGFLLVSSYCDSDQMRDGIRFIESAVPGTELTPTQEAALLENLRLVIVRTALGARARDSLRVQSRLRRWEFLRGGLAGSGRRLLRRVTLV